MAGPTGWTPLPALVVVGGGFVGVWGLAVALPPLPWFPGGVSWRLFAGVGVVPVDPLPLPWLPVPSAMVSGGAFWARCGEELMKGSRSAGKSGQSFSICIPFVLHITQKTSPAAELCPLM